MTIIVNNEKTTFSKEDFPMLINGADKSGASYFSICLVAQLFEQNEKILFFTASPEAKEEFRKQIGENLNNNALIIESGDENDFIDKIDEINDINERIVLVKNIENYSENLFNKLKNLKLVIFSGDMDKCRSKEQLSVINFKTKIFFSYSEAIKVENKINLIKYSGHIISDKYRGLISVSV